MFLGIFDTGKKRKPKKTLLEEFEDELPEEIFNA